LFAGVATSCIVLSTERRAPSALLKHISWSVLPLVAGLFVLVEGLVRTGLVRDLTQALQSLALSSPHAASWAAGTTWKTCPFSTWCARAATLAGTRPSSRTRRCCKAGQGTRVSCRLSGSCAAGNAERRARPRSRWNSGHGIKTCSGLNDRLWPWCALELWRRLHHENNAPCR
jgi:hypothetical protein